MSKGEEKDKAFDARWVVDTLLGCVLVGLGTWVGLLLGSLLVLVAVVLTGNVSMAMTQGLLIGGAAIGVAIGVCAWLGARRIVLPVLREGRR